MSPIKDACAGLTDKVVAEAGKLLGVNQPKISALMTGKLDGFSSERLFRFLNALDQEIEIIIKPQKSPNQTPTINVICH